MPFFTVDKKVDNEARDYNYYVPVIASFDAQGNIRPLYFRHRFENGDTIKVQIDNVISTKPLNIFGTEFVCTVTVGEVQRQVVLCYFKDTYRWSLRD